MHMSLVNGDVVAAAVTPAVAGQIRHRRQNLLPLLAGVGPPRCHPSTPLHCGASLRPRAPLLNLLHAASPPR
jgi:hypothetical protein